jgi:hypothetical protein
MLEDVMKGWTVSGLASWIFILTAMDMRDEDFF